MTPDQELTLIFGVLHLLAICLGGVLLWMFARSEPVNTWEPPDDEGSDGGGGNDRLDRHPKSPSPGGVPLPDARQAPIRLRAPGRLADAYRAPARRPDHEPTRTPERV